MLLVSLICLLYKEATVLIGYYTRSNEIKACNLVAVCDPVVLSCCLSDISKLNPPLLRWVYPVTQWAPWSLPLCIPRCCPCSYNILYI